MKLTKADREALHEVKCLLEDTSMHYTIRQLVRKSGMNADKLKTAFRVTYGVTPHRYHLLCKTAAAKKLLLSTDLNIDETARQLGYNDANNFSAFFKKMTGCSPGAWKKKFQQ